MTKTHLLAVRIGGDHVHREDVFVDRSEQEDEQRLREVPMCERGSVGICCHDSPHAEAVDPPVRAFHTVSKRNPSTELLLIVDMRSSGKGGR